ncbi:DNA repair endonuclease XPF [Anthonomus grandis grandis]|uniref:DNA repair endonuclease XPF n=1 Tax=Anthonomus grandis grandis TaxID=2921223 RepID=UPI0021669B3B|nr:DNA repair endonuclease XPF [Anthonomus grandis grandis]
MDLENSQIDSLLDKVNIEFMLEFETQIFLDIVRTDGLVIAAKGLNLDLVLLNILKVYQDPGNLVLVLNATEAEQKHFDEKLNCQHVYIEHDNAQFRMEEYLCGGIHFVPSRILVVDLLKKRLPIDKITGIIVLRAHRIFESCNEAFILKLYRQHNKTGFIKAFSNSPQSFTVGFCQVERVMRALFVKELHIWPRFHVLVRQSLKKHEPQVIELHIPITEQMKKLQTYILEIMNATVKELKRLNPGLEMQEITVENCLTKKFHKILQAQMNLIWHQLNDKSTRLIAELKALRHLLLSMFYSDPVSFYATLLEYRKVEYARTADWVLNSSAELLFRDASALVFSGDREFNPQFCPKWDALLEILKIDIPAHIKKSGNTENTTVLILCNDNRTCHQLNEVLTSGPFHYMFFLALKKKISFKSVSSKFKNCPELPDIARNEEQPPKQSKHNKKQKTGKEQESTSAEKQESQEEVEDNEDFQSTYILTMSQSVLDDFDESATKDQSSMDESAFTPFTQMENMNLTQICESLTAPKILIQTFKGGENYISLQNNLQVLKPNYVIMYHSNITAVREIEMYEAHRQSETPLKVYFLIHATTVEEQSYLTTLRREKEAFEFLIETKATMVVPEDQDGKSEHSAALQRGGLTPEKNTRKGGQQEEPVKRLVIVDMREFRSDLPSLIHKRGIEIEPVTITVGDYILTPEICVERKSISDLISSLNSGRLYQQCTQMQRFYTKPMLLIEFDQNKPFGWNSHYMISRDDDNFNIQEKLILLTMHFPKLRIIWSPSPYATAQLFEELKQGKEEPSIENAMAIGGDEDLDSIETKYNSTIYDFVQKLPGISSKNLDVFLRKGVNMLNIIKMSEEELKDILGNSADARALHTALHSEAIPKNEQKEKPKFSKGRGGSSSRGFYSRGSRGK